MNVEVTYIPDQVVYVICDNDIVETKVELVIIDKTYNVLCKLTPGVFNDPFFKQSEIFKTEKDAKDHLALNKLTELDKRINELMKEKEKLQKLLKG